MATLIEQELTNQGAQSKRTCALTGLPLALSQDVFQIGRKRFIGLDLATGSREQVVDWLRDRLESQSNHIDRLQEQRADLNWQINCSKAEWEVLNQAVRDLESRTSS